MPGPVVTACWRRHRAPVTVVTASPSSPAARPTSSCPVLLPAGPANMDPAHTSSASGHRPRRCHALAPSDSPAPPPSSATSVRDSGFPCAGTSSLTSTASPSSGPAGSERRRLHALPSRCNHASRSCTATFFGCTSRPRRSCSVRIRARRSCKRSSPRVLGVRLAAEVPAFLPPLSGHYRAAAFDGGASASLCDATFTSARDLANHLQCHDDQAGPPGTACVWRVRHRLLTTHIWYGPRRLRPLGRGASSPALIGEPPAFVYVFPSG
ncbi:hypothetical protein MRX96_040590 [Rhipicephalus microplus]